MRVCYDQQIFSRQRMGGVSRYFVELMSRLQLSGNVDVFLPFPYTANEYLAQTPPPLRRRRILRRRYFKGQWLLEWPLHRWSRRQNDVALRKQCFDVLHPTYYDPYFLEMIGQRPFVLTVFDMIQELHPQLFPQDHLAEICAWKRRTAHGAAHIIAISECTKRDLVRLLDIPPDKISVVYLGAFDQPERSVCNRPTGTDADSPYLLFVGRRDSYKAFDLLLDGVAPLLRSGACQLICVGGGAFKPAEYRRMKGLQVAEKVRQRDVSDAELQALYAAAEMLVFPSLYEGFGLPILEAFACGCPVALSDRSCFPEIAGDAAVYFDPERPDSIHAAIRSVLTDRQLRTSLVDRGRRRLQIFSWDTCALQTKEVYQSVLDKQYFQVSDSRLTGL